MTDPAGTLLTLVEIAVALLGFAGVVTALSAEPKGTTLAGREFRILVLVIAGSGAVVFSFIPVVALALDVPQHTVWSWMSLASAALLIGFLTWGLFRQKKLFGAYVPPGAGATDSSLIAVVGLCSVAAVGNAIGWGLDQEFAGYLIAITPWFYVAILVFFRTLFDSRYGRDG